MGIIRIILVAFWVMNGTLWGGQSAPVVSTHTTSTLISSVTHVAAGQSFWMMLQMTLRPGWMTYWINPGSSGKPLEITWTLPDGFTASPVFWQVPKVFSTNGLLNYGYEQTVRYLVQITPPPTWSGKEEAVTIKASAEWLVCDDHCIPESGVYEISLQRAPQPRPSAHHDVIQTLVKALPKQRESNITYYRSGEHIVIHIPDHLVPEKHANLTFLSSIPDQLDETKPQHLDRKKHHYELSVPTSAPLLTGLVRVEDADGQTTHSFSVQMTTPPAEAQSFHSLFFAIIGAFLGGLILNAMPCVFPVLSLKALSVAKKQGAEKQQIRTQGLMYTAGVMVCFLGLASTLIALRQAGEAVGWGFQMQSPFFIVCMIDLIFLIALSLSGFFYLPVLFGSTTANEQSAWGSFWIGSVAVLIATPCTAPFMGAAMGYAFAQPIPVILFIFTALGIGFAAPYLLICFFPQSLKVFPKPGAWMETLKEFLAFPMYATVVWLVWVLLQQTGTFGFLIAGSNMILIAFSLWLWRQLDPQTAFKKVTVAVGLCLLCYTPVHYLPQGDSVTVAKPFSREAITSYLRDGNAVLVNVTAAWCLTCKVNEHLFHSDTARHFFKNNDIVYLEADWTSKNPEITAFLSDFQRQGVPLYVFFPKGNLPPRVLPQLLSEADILTLLE